MTQRALTSRQVEMLRVIEAKAGTDEEKALVAKASLGTLRLHEIDDVVKLINDEYLMKCIKEDWEPNEYGKELYQLLGVINEPRLRYDAEELDKIRQADLRRGVSDEQIR